ncbi:MAG: Ku protein [Acidobacteriota bacterium]
MELRPAWKGVLKLSLIVIPVRAYAATRAGADVSFHQFHRKCHTQIQMKKWCPHCKRDVSNDEITKGHETSKGRVVFAEESEIKGLRPTSTQTIDVSSVMDASVIDPRYIERVYYVLPDNDRAASAFAVVRKALAGKAAVGRLAFHGREYLTAVLPDERAMLMYTLRTAGEVVNRKDLPSVPSGSVKDEEVRLARRVLEGFVSGAKLDTFVDNYEQALRAMLKRKGAGEPVQPEDEGAASPRKVVNLMDALRRSLDAAQATPKRSSVKGAPKVKGSARMLKHNARRPTRRAS